jgi:hypothetical protein
MATVAQVAANRQNAQRPRTLTEDTKESLRTRAVKHGLTAKLYTNTVLSCEDQEAYNQMLQSLLAEATLGTTQEAMLIQALAQTFWKMQRASNMEAGAISAGLADSRIQLKITEQTKDPKEVGAQLAFVLWEYSDKLDKVRRYANAAERGFFRVTKELAQLRKAGPQEQIGYVPQTAKPEETKEPEIGYDPQKAPPPQHPHAIPRPEFGGMTPFAFFDKLENATDDEAMAFLDQLTIPKRKAKS